MASLDQLHRGLLVGVLAMCRCLHTDISVSGMNRIFPIAILLSLRLILSLSLS
jgi:hypothetical protein